MVNTKAANIQKLLEFYRRPNHTSQLWLMVVMANQKSIFCYYYKVALSIWFTCCQINQTR